MNSGIYNWNSPVRLHPEGNDTGFKANGYLHVEIETNIECAIYDATCY